MPQRGKLVVLVMFATAIALGGYAWWFRLDQGRLAREFWGPKATRLIQRAPVAHLLQLEANGQGRVVSAVSGVADEEPAVLLPLNSAALKVVRRADISGAPGMLHARHALVQDVNFDWQADEPRCPDGWAFALEFRDGSQSTTVLFDPGCLCVRRLADRRSASLDKSLMESFAGLTDEWFAYAGDESSRDE